MQSSTRVTSGDYVVLRSTGHHVLEFLFEERLCFPKSLNTLCVNGLNFHCNPFFIFIELDEEFGNLLLLLDFQFFRKSAVDIAKHAKELQHRECYKHTFGIFGAHPSRFFFQSSLFFLSLVKKSADDADKHVWQAYDGEHDDQTSDFFQDRSRSSNSSFFFSNSLAAEEGFAAEFVKILAALHFEQHYEPNLGLSYTRFLGSSIMLSIKTNAETVSVMATPPHSSVDSGSMELLKFLESDLHVLPTTHYNRFRKFGFAVWELEHSVLLEVVWLGILLPLQTINLRLTNHLHLQFHCAEENEKLKWVEFVLKVIFVLVLRMRVLLSKNELLGIALFHFMTVMEKGEQGNLCGEAHHSFQVSVKRFYRLCGGLTIVFKRTEAPLETTSPPVNNEEEHLSRLDPPKGSVHLSRDEPPFTKVGDLPTHACLPTESLQHARHHHCLGEEECELSGRTTREDNYEVADTSVVLGAKHSKLWRAWQRLIRDMHGMVLLVGNRDYCLSGDSVEDEDVIADLPRQILTFEGAESHPVSFGEGEECERSLV